VTVPATPVGPAGVLLEELEDQQVFVQARQEGTGALAGRPTTS
jgi:hypothetical protein